MNISGCIRLIKITSTVLAAVFLTACSKEARKERHIARAEALYESGQYDAARIEYYNALRIEPTNLRAIERIGRIFFDQGRLKDSAPFLAEASRRASTNAEVRTRFGRLLVAAQKVPEARKEAIAALDHQPTHEDAVILLAETSLNPEEVADARRRIQELRQKTGPHPAHYPL